MDKKNLVLQILTKLKPYRDKAAALEIVVPFCNDDDALLDMVLTALHHGVQDTLQAQGQDKLQHSIDLIKKIRAQEAATDSDAIQIDTLLQDI